VQQVTEGAGAARVAGLRAEGAEPHVVPGLDLHPVGVEEVDGLALEHVEPVLHHVGLRERDHAAGLEAHDLHVNIGSFEPGGVIPCPESHVMEHGLYVLEGKAVTSSTPTGWRSRPGTT